MPEMPSDLRFGARGRIRTDDLPITSRMLRVDLDGSRRIEPAHVGCVVGPDGSRRIQKDRLDDQMDDQGASDTESDAKASTVVALFIRRSLGRPCAGPPSVTLPRRKLATLAGDGRG